MPKSVSFDRMPELNPLFLDYIGKFDQVKSLYNIDYRLEPQKWDLPERCGG